MDWQTRWQQIWRHQPVLWVQTGGQVVLYSLLTWLALWAVRTQQAMLRTFAQDTSATPGPGHEMEAFSAIVASAQASMLALHLLRMAVFVLAIWTVRLAFAQPTRPLSWRTVGRQFWIPLVRAAVVYGLQTLALIVFLTVGLVPAFVVFVVGLWLLPPMVFFVLIVVGGLGLWWALLPWWFNFWIAAIVEHPATPPTTWRRYWGVMRRYAARFRGLAFWQWLLWVVVGGAWSGLLWIFPWVHLLLTDDPRSLAAATPAWVGPVALGLAWLLAIGRMYLLVGWTSAYWDASQRWQHEAQRLAAASASKGGRYGQ